MRWGSQAQKMATVAKLRRIWKEENSCLGSKIRLLCVLTFPIFLYVWESWTFNIRITAKNPIIRNELLQNYHWYFLLRWHQKSRSAKQTLNKKRVVPGRIRQSQKWKKKPQWKWCEHVNKRSAIYPLLPYEAKCHLTLGKIEEADRMMENFRNVPKTLVSGLEDHSQRLRHWHTADIYVGGWLSA